MNQTLRGVLGLGAVLAAAGLVACGTPKPSKELVEARSAYDEVSKGNAQQTVPDRVLSAKQALDRAEAAFEEEPNSFEEESLAYLAHREALMAEILADQAEANKEIEANKTEYISLQEALYKADRKELQKTTKELAKEKAARLDAERKYNAALKSLEEIARVKEESRGTVITLSGEVLFASGKTTLLPIAQQKLDKVAEVLQEQDPAKKFVVEGHTDSVGSEDNNFRLSRDRAETVRSYLVGRGVAAEQISAVGKGESTPVADNKTPEGRANNRRVEIVIN